MRAFSIITLLIAAAFTGCGGSNTNTSEKTRAKNTVEPKVTTVLPDTAKNATTAPANSGGFGESLTAQSSDLNATESEFEIVLNLSTDVLFDFDKAEVKPAAEPELKKAADIIKSKGKGITKIVGYTDAKGDDAYNQTLSEKRAVAIATWFKNNGLSSFQFTTAGNGEKDPIAANTNADGSDNPEGRAKNRRVTLTINKTNTLGK